MTLSISDTKKNTKEKSFFLQMLVMTLFCILFALVYNHFGHGIRSVFMDRMFMIPLGFGMIGYGILCLLRKNQLEALQAMRCYNVGIVTLVLGSMLRGIFDIAGTASPYVRFYWIAGIILILLGIAGYVKKEFFYE